MKRKFIFISTGLIVLLFSTWQLTRPVDDYSEFMGVVKVSLRDAGHQLLLAGKDSTSLVLPIKVLQPFKFRLTFQNDLIIEPDSLVSIVDRSLQKASLPDAYRVEVLACTTTDVFYSYEMFEGTETGIVPCSGRNLPKNCYDIDVNFTRQKQTPVNHKIYYGIGVLGLVLLFLGLKKQKSKQISLNSQQEHIALGSFNFYPEQNKLVKQATEISLSRKECELLELFVARPNQIIKRDELTKAVWEDHGVFVGRSLDTYISKLRKKLKGDNSIKITNIHGVGYKLEV
ncbi:MAG TPA: winged helix-turn-helix domain-containing protein [Flavobacteriaceae bacterium]|nr:winged helix-turn-helix domain-containing protein [Flavobacteriaceae bacterium]